MGRGAGPEGIVYSEPDSFFAWVVKNTHGHTKEKNESGSRDYGRHS